MQCNFQEGMQLLYKSTEIVSRKANIHLSFEKVTLIINSYTIRLNSFIRKPIGIEFYISPKSSSPSVYSPHY